MNGYRDVAHVIRYDEERLKYCENEILESGMWIKKLENRRKEYSDRAKVSLWCIAVFGGLASICIVITLLAWGHVDSNGHYSFGGPYANDVFSGTLGMVLYLISVFLVIGLIASIIWNRVSIKNSRYYISRHRPGTHLISEVIAVEKAYIEKMQAERAVAAANYEADKRKVYENTNNYRPEEEAVIDFSELIKARETPEIEDKSYFADTFTDLSRKDNKKKR